MVEQYCLKTRSASNLGEAAMEHASLYSVFCSTCAPAPVSGMWMSVLCQGFFCIELHPYTLSPQQFFTGVYKGMRSADSEEILFVSMWLCEAAHKTLVLEGCWETGQVLKEGFLQWAGPRIHILCEWCWRNLAFPVLKKCLEKHSQIWQDHLSSDGEYNKWPQQMVYEVV